MTQFPSIIILLECKILPKIEKIIYNRVNYGWSMWYIYYFNTLYKNHNLPWTGLISVTWHKGKNRTLKLIKTILICKVRYTWHIFYLSILDYNNFTKQTEEDRDLTWSVVRLITFKRICLTVILSAQHKDNRKVLYGVVLITVI